MNAFRALFVTVVLVASAVALPGEASAHQPRLPIGADVTILDPEVSKAYYTTLDGRGHTYRIRTAVAFDLYVSLTVPDISGQGTDISAVVVRVDGNGGTIGTLNGVAHQWTKFFEPFGFSDYLQGPEYRGRAEPGDYEIRVTSPRNDRKYVLVVGEIEAFDFKETVNALDLVPLIKRDFFWGNSRHVFLFSHGVCLCRGSFRHGVRRGCSFASSAAPSAMGRGSPTNPQYRFYRQITSVVFRGRLVCLGDRHHMGPNHTLHVRVLPL